jgi:hypothetical protein
MRCSDLDNAAQAASGNAMCGGNLKCISVVLNQAVPVATALTACSWSNVDWLFRTIVNFMHLLGRCAP